jgi:hypothetical protein
MLVAFATISKDFRNGFAVVAIRLLDVYIGYKSLIPTLF